MAQSADKIVVENGYWPCINRCLRILKLLIRYMLIIVCSFFACFMIKFGSFFDYISERLLSTNSDEDVAQIKPHSNVEVIEEKIEQKSKPQIDDEIDLQSSNQAVIEEKVEEQTSQTQINEEIDSQSSNPEVIEEKIEQTSQFQTNEEIGFQSSDQEVIDEKIEETSQSQINEEIGFQSSNQETIEEEVEQTSQSKINGEIDFQSSANQEVIQKNLEQTYVKLPQTDEELDVQSSSPKVIEENKRREKVKPKIEKRCPVKRNAAIFLFSKTMKEIEDHDKKKIGLEDEKLKTNELNTKMTKSCETVIYGSERSPCKEKNNRANTSNSWKKVPQFIQDEPVQNDGLNLANGSHDNALLAQSLVNTTSEQSEKRIPTNNDSDDSFYHGHNIVDNRESRRSTLLTDKLSTVLKKVDAFDLPTDYPLALCITEDLQFSMGTAVYFKEKYGGVGKLMDQNLRLGDIGHIVHRGQFIFYLVVREKYKTMPSTRILENALLKLCDKMNVQKLTKLAIPKNGFDRFMDDDIMRLTSKIFGKHNIEVTMCTKESKLDIPRHFPTKINCTKKNLWEMEPQTDIVIFINMEQMYLNSWNDKIVENIDLKYPFKRRLLEDINIKPMAAGDILTYTINNEELFCIFTKPIERNPFYFECLDRSFKTMKSKMTGYRYIAIQSETIYDPNTRNGIPRQLLLLQTIFSSFKAEIWICNDNDLCQRNQLEHYNIHVNSAIERNKRSLRSSQKPKYRGDRKKTGNENVTRMHGYVEASANKKHGNRAGN